MRSSISVISTSSVGAFCVSMHGCLALSVPRGSSVKLFVLMRDIKHVDMPQNPMLFAHLESFLEVARQGNVSLAADALFLTQPAITARLKSLETDLGVELF